MVGQLHRAIAFHALWAYTGSTPGEVTLNRVCATMTARRDEISKVLTEREAKRGDIKRTGFVVVGCDGKLRSDAD